MLIKANHLELTYEVRKLGPDRSWFKHLLKPVFERHTVLNELMLEVKEPGITAILGRNGAGKTTLIKVLSGILTPTKGEVTVLGYTPSKRSPQLLRQIGAVFGQKKMLWPELSLRENFAITAAVYSLSQKETKARIHYLIEKFNLESFLDRPVKTLSLGESMKAELAGIFLFKPRILFLDEPTIGLDVAAQVALRENIKQYIKDNECHILLTSHNMRDISSLANKTLIMEKGKLTEFNVETCCTSIEEQLEQRLTSL